MEQTISDPAEGVGEDNDGQSSEAQGRNILGGIGGKVDLGKANVAAARFGGWLKSQAAKATETLDSQVKELKENTKLIVSDITDTVQKDIGEAKRASQKLQDTISGKGIVDESQFDVTFTEKALGLELDLKGGARVKGITEGGQAERLKVQVLDRLVAVAGESLPPLPASGLGDDDFVSAVKGSMKNLPRPVTFTFARPVATHESTASAQEPPLSDTNLDAIDLLESPTGSQSFVLPAQRTPLVSTAVIESLGSSSSKVAQDATPSIERPDLKNLLSFEAFAEARDKSSPDLLGLSPSASTNAMGSWNAVSPQVLTLVPADHTKDEAAIGAMRKRCEELEKLCDEAKRDALVQKEVAERNSMQAASSARESADAHARASALQEEINVLVRESRQKAMQTDAEITRLRAQLEQGEASAGSSAQEFAEARARVSALQQELDSLSQESQQRLAQAEAEMAKLRAQLDEVMRADKEKLNELEDKLSHAEQERAALNQQVEAFKGKLACALVERDDAAERARNADAVAASLREAHASETTEKIVEIEELKGKVACALAERDDAAERARSADALAASLREAHASETTEKIVEIEELKGKVACALAERDDAAERARSADALAASLREAHASEATDKIVELEDRLSHAEAARAKSIVEADAARSQLAALDDLQAKLEEALRRISEEARRADETAQLLTLQTEAATAREQQLQERVEVAENRESEAHRLNDAQTSEASERLKELQSQLETAEGAQAELASASSKEAERHATEAQRLQDELEALKKSLEVNESASDEASRQAEVAFGKLDQMERVAAESDAVLKERLQELETNLQAAEQAGVEEASKVNSLRSELAAATSEASAARIEFSVSETAALESKNAAQRAAELAAVEAAKAAESTESEVACLRLELKVAKQDEANLESETSSLMSAVTEKTSEATSLRAEVAAARAETTAVQTSASVQEQAAFDKISTLQQQLKEIQNAHASLSESSTQNVSSAHSEVARIKSELEQYQGYARGLVDAEAQAADATKRELETRVQGLREEIKSAKTEGCNLENSLAASAEELKAAKTDACDLRNAMASYVEELNASKAESGELRISASAYAEAATSEIGELKRHVSDVRAAHASLAEASTESAALANSELRSLRSELDQCRTEANLQVTAEVQEERYKAENRCAALENDIESKCADLQKFEDSLKASEDSLKLELEAAERRAAEADTAEATVAQALLASKSSLEQLGHEVAEAKAQEDAATNAVLLADQMRMMEVGTVEADTEAQLQAMEARMKEAEETCAAETRAAQRFKAMKEDAAKVARAALERAEQSEMSRMATTASEPAVPENAAKASVPASTPLDGASPETVVSIEEGAKPIEATQQCPDAPVPTSVGKPGAATDRDPSAEDCAADDELEVYDRLLGGGGAAQPKASGKNKVVGRTSSGGNVALADPRQRIAQLEAQNRELRKLVADSDRDVDAEAALPNGQTPVGTETLHSRVTKFERLAVAGCRRKQGFRQADKGLRMFTRMLLRNPVVLWIFYSQLLLLWFVVVLRQA